MEPTTIALTILGSAFVAFHIGYIIGYGKAFNIGFADGADRGVKSVLEQLSKDLNLSFEYNVDIVEKNNE
jgi:hypothetical protein